MDLNDTPEQAALSRAGAAWLEEQQGPGATSSGSSEDSDYIDSRRAWQRSSPRPAWPG